MKIRNGYVSNSSSSSFIVVGYRISNPLKAIKEGKCVMVYVEAGGNSGECEDWSMFLTKDTYDILQKSQWIKKINPIYIEVDMSAKCQFDNDMGDNKLIVSRNVLGEVFAFNRDYSSPNSEKELVDFLKMEGYEYEA